MKIQATARVQITVEVTAGVWGDDCTAAQVFDQAAREAINAVQVAIQSRGNMRVTGEPKVTAVFTTRDEP